MRGSTFRPNAATRELWLIGGVLCGPPLRPSAYVALEQLTPTSPQPYRFTAIVNASDDSEAVVERSIAPGQLQAADRALNLPYPAGIFSLSHLAIPIPMDDPLYGLKPDPKAPPEFGFSLGALAARGERGTLVVDQDFLTRLPSNPFFPYLLERVDDGITRPSGPTGRNLAATPSPGIPVRLEAVLPASPILQYRGVGNVSLPALLLSTDRSQFMPARRSASAWSKASTRINPRRGYSRSMIT